MDIKNKKQEIEDLKSLLEEKKQTLKAYQKEKDIYYNTEQAIKILLNSIYGCFGSEYFTFFKKDIAESITLQAQHLIRHSEDMVNKYFMEYWHKDFKLHEKLGIKIKPNAKVSKPVWIYTDTDSCAPDTIIITDKGKLTIEELYNSQLNINGPSDESKAGHESTTTDLKILNYVDNKIQFVPVNRLIRHKLNKPKWRVKTKSGKFIDITGDHSIMVFRDGKKLKAKPSEVNIETDKILSIHKAIKEEIQFEFEDIESVEIIGDFENEYGYDIEVIPVSDSNEDQHTFIANDILVHNSGYVAFDEPFSLIENFDNLDTKQLIFDLVNFRFESYLSNVFEKYATDHNTENYQDFEMESVSKQAVWLAKKNYILNIAWEDGVNRDDLSTVMIKGWDTVKSSTPSFCRKHLKEMIIFLFTQERSIDEVSKRVKDIKKQFKLARIEDISKNIKVNNYQKYLINDTTGVEFRTGAPYNLKGAMLHNYFVQSSKFKNKYGLITSGDKVKLYFTKNQNKGCDNFAFLPGYHPYEIAPEIDYDEQFTKTFLDPLNRVLTSMKMRELNPNLMFAKSLF